MGWYTARTCEYKEWDRIDDRSTCSLFSRSTLLQRRGQNREYSRSRESFVHRVQRSRCTIATRTDYAICRMGDGVQCTQDECRCEFFATSMLQPRHSQMPRLRATVRLHCNYVYGCTRSFAFPHPGRGSCYTGLRVQRDRAANQAVNSHCPIRRDHGCLGAVGVRLWHACVVRGTQ